ncbi:hypothetical protein [Massilia sp. TN1-12]|uniref:hypothetical protein n=1 Tax=Massilia paldalensis TaxID=3377675 RepID=UPI00384AAC71
MTDRRSTITLNWRPAGQPARRVDDFAEVPYTPRNATRRQERQDHASSPIHERLQNWARWANAKERFIARSATAAFCDRLKKEAGLLESFSDERRRMDDEDAYLIELSLFHLRGTQKAILRMHYVEGRAWQPIMRVLQFPVRRELFESLLRTAQAAVELMVEKNTERQR